MEMDPKKYKKEVKWSDEDGVFVARAPEIPGCSTHGDTEAEALDNLNEVLILAIEALAENELEKTDGIAKFLFRLPVGVKSELVKESNEHDMSINEVILHFVKEGLKFGIKTRAGLSGRLNFKDQIIHRHSRDGRIVPQKHKKAAAKRKIG